MTDSSQSSQNETASDLSDLDRATKEGAEAIWKEDSTPFERVKSIISHTHEYQSAGEIAERARVSPPTARKQLESLHRSGYVVIRDGRPTGYKRNPDQRRFERIQQFADRYTRDELTSEIREMKEEIADIREEYSVASPASLVAALEADDEGGWRMVRRWRTFRRDLALAEAALAFMATREIDDDAVDGESISPRGAV